MKTDKIVALPNGGNMAKCSKCGYLAARNKDTRNLEEVEFASRQSGDLRTNRYDYMPVCFAMAVSFDEEVARLREEPQYATEKRDAYGQTIWPRVRDLIEVVLDAERQCKSFAEWHQGSTPKEHQETLDRKAMLEWQAKREDADREWREKQEKKRSEEEWKRYAFLAIMTIIGVIIGVLLTVITRGIK